MLRSPLAQALLPQLAFFVETPQLPLTRFHRHNSIFLSLYLSLFLPCLWRLNEPGPAKVPRSATSLPISSSPWTLQMPHSVSAFRQRDEIGLWGTGRAGDLWKKSPLSLPSPPKKEFPTSRSSWNLGWAFVRLAVCKWPFYDRTQLGSMLTLSSPERTVSNVSVHILKSVLGWLWGNREEGLSLGELERVKYCTKNLIGWFRGILFWQMVYLCNNNTN